MSLLTKATKLLASGNISAASAIAILPLAAATADASITFQQSDSSADSFVDKSGGNNGIIADDAFTSYANSGGSSCYFNFHLGNGTQTDSAIFTTNSFGRSSNVNLYGNFTGTLEDNEQVKLDYTITTTLSDGSATSVAYEAYLFLFESDNYRYIAGSDLSGGEPSTISLGTATASSAPITYEGEALTYTSSDFSDNAGMWMLTTYFDWDIENYVAEGDYSDTEILAIVMQGTISVVTAGVPEPSTWGLIGAGSVLGFAGISRRKRKSAGK